MERITAVAKHFTEEYLNTEKKDIPTKTDNMSVPYKFQGWMGLDKESTKGNMVWQEFEPKTWTEDDVDIKVTHCGIW